MITSCLPVARIAVTIERPNVGEVPPAIATRTMSRSYADDGVVADFKIDVV